MLEKYPAFSSFLSETRQILIPEMRRHCDLLENLTVKKNSDFSQTLFNFLISGKFFRATLLRLVALSFRSDNFSDILSLAVSLEFAHGALLIHDDIIDNDDFRRYQPSLHRKFESNFSTFQDSDHLGKSLAMLSGDLLFLYIFSIISHLPEIVSLFSKELSKTTFGQCFDLENSLNKDVKKDEIFLTMEYKTARYTFFLPIASGLLISKNSEIDVQFVKEFSQIAGCLFQIKDDELDFSSYQETGKSSGSDIVNFKKNLCCYEILKRYPESEHLFSSEEYLQEIQAIYTTSGAKDEINRKVRSLVAMLRSMVEKIPIEETWKQIWKEMIDYLGGREA